MEKRSVKVLLGVLAGSLLMGAAQAQGLIPITIGIMAPRTGVYVNLGDSLHNGAMMAYKKAIPEFAKLGFNLRVSVFDDKGTADFALEQSKKLVIDKSLLIVMGPTLSDSGLAMMPSMNLRHLAMVSPFAIDDDLTKRRYSNFFRIVPRAETFTQAESDFVLNTLQVASVYVINDGTQLGRDRSKLLIKYFNRNKATVSDAWTINPDTNFDTLAQKVLATKAQSVHMAVSQYTVSGGMVNALRTVGYTGPIFTSAVLNPAFQKLVGKNLEGLYFINNLATLAAFPRTKEFVVEYQKEYGSEPITTAILGYDAMDVCIEALLKTLRATDNKLPTRQQVEDNVGKVSFQGLTGNISFVKTGDREENALFVLQVGKDSIPRIVTALTVETQVK
jgi:branched-chain amino acid transport system substrate-binding protein